MVLVEKGLALSLDAGDHGRSVLGDDLRVFGIAFVGPTPAVVAGDRDRRRERPVHADGAHLGGGGRADTMDQFRIVRRAQADIVRIKGGAENVVVTMDGIRRPDHRDDDLVALGIDRGFVIWLDQIDPVLDAGVLIAAWDRASTIFDAADMVSGDLVRRDRLEFGLDDLPDLFLDRHLLKECVNLAFDRRI